jgi:hypothetical protein
MSNFEYQRTLLIGVIIGASICILGFSMMRPTQPVEALEPKGNFEVVDTYRGCDVVRYTDGSMATYKYFLDCTDSMRNK